MKSQIDHLIQDSLSLLKARLGELGISAKSPSVIDSIQFHEKLRTFLLEFIRFHENYCLSGIYWKSQRYRVKPSRFAKKQGYYWNRSSTAWTWTGKNYPNQGERNDRSFAQAGMYIINRFQIPISRKKTLFQFHVKKN